MLNKEINEILSILENRKIPYHLSTNAYNISNFHPDSLEYLTVFKVLLCGISSEKYERIYGLDIKEVMSNILRLQELLRKYGKENLLEISYFVYRFNMDEFILAQKVFQNIKIVPRLAYFADFDQCQEWLNNEMDTNLKEQAEMEIVTDLLEEKRVNMPDDFLCPQLGGIGIR